jgi:hypothetical protein
VNGKPAFGVNATLWNPRLPSALAVEYQRAYFNGSYRNIGRIEASAWLIFSIGGGVDLISGNGRKPAYDAYIGYPLPLLAQTMAWKGYGIMPYYRRVWMRKDVSNEFGLVLGKYTGY